MNKFFNIAVLAGLGMTLLATDADACCLRKRASAPVAYNSGCNGCGSTGYASSGQPVNAYGQPVYAYGQSGYTTNPPVVMMPMATPTPMTTTAVVGKPGTITVMVPSADAQVWFEDTALLQTGKERTFNTPVLTDGKAYNYNVKAKWTNESGKTVEKILPVNVRAGQTSTVDFR